MATARLLGEPDKVIVEDDLAIKAFYIQPTTPADEGGWSLSGGGNTTYRIRLAAYAGDYVKAGMVGEYTVTKQASTVVLRKA